jgi:anti-anti-sigma factor
MPLHKLEASVRQQSGVAIIDLHGDIDGNAEHALMDAYDKAEGQDPAAILLNFTQVAYINSKGIALIVVLLRRAASSDYRLLVCSLRDHFREIFRITRLSDYMSICSDEESALAKFLTSDKDLRAASGQQRAGAL